MHLDHSQAHCFLIENSSHHFHKIQKHLDRGKCTPVRIVTKFQPPGHTSYTRVLQVVLFFIPFQKAMPCNFKVNTSFTSTFILSGPSKKNKSWIYSLPFINMTLGDRLALYSGSWYLARECCKGINLGP